MPSKRLTKKPQVTPSHSQVVFLNLFQNLRQVLPLQNPCLLYKIKFKFLQIFQSQNQSILKNQRYKIFGQLKKVFQTTMSTLPFQRFFQKVFITNHGTFPSLVLFMKTFYMSQDQPHSNTFINTILILILRIQPAPSKESYIPQNGVTTLILLFLSLQTFKDRTLIFPLIHTGIMNKPGSTPSSYKIKEIVTHGYFTSIQQLILRTFPFGSVIGGICLVVFLSFFLNTLQ